MHSSQTSVSRSKVVIPHRPKWHGRLAAFSIAAAGKLLGATWRIRWHDQSGLAELQEGPVIFATWHNRLGVSMAFWKQVQKRLYPAAGLAALISASKDGGLLARTLEHFGVKGVRGSSSRRGAQGLLELTSALEDGFHVAITPDGPRGPKYSVSQGIIALAQLTGRPIVPMGAVIRPKIRLNSWDNFLVPLPFSRCELFVGKPIFVPRELTDEAREQIRQQLSEAMRQINQD